MEWRDPNTGQIKMWVWVASGLAVVVGLFLFKGISSGQSTTTGTTIAGGQSSDTTDLISQLEQALQDLQKQAPNPDPPIPPIVHKHTLKPYTVKSGDTWNSIATHFGMTLDQFFRHNPDLKSLGTPDQARAGGRIVQVFKGEGTGNNPPPAPKTYVVKAGDTFKMIATKFNLTRAQFYSLNPTLPTTHFQMARGGGRTVTVGTANTH
jgi:LysM repeat protein